MEKKCCRNCKYAHRTFGTGLKEEFQIWECKSLVLIEDTPTNFPIALNHCCEWWNWPKRDIAADVKKMKEEFAKRRRMEKGVCLGKISDLKFGF